MKNKSSLTRKIISFIIFLFWKVSKKIQISPDSQCGGLALKYLTNPTHIIIESLFEILSL